MALESGMRRVRMVGAEHWTDTPERELATIAAGGDTYAVHERVCIDSARVRLVLAEGEDVSAALREVYGEAVRDVRVFRLVDSPADVVEGLPEWRFTLPLVDDPAHDPLPGMIARLAGAAPAPVEVSDATEAPDLQTADVQEVVAEDVPALEPVLAEAPVLEAAVLEPEPEPVAEPLAVDDVPVLEPIADEPSLEQPPFVLPEGLVLPEEPAVDVLAAEVPVLETPALEVAAADEPQDAGHEALAAAAAAAVAAVPVEDPYAVPAESALPIEAVEPVDAVDADPVELEAVDAVDAETVELEVVDAVAAEPVVEDSVEAVEAVGAPVEDSAEEPVEAADVVEAVVETAPEPEPEPDPRDLLFAPTAAVLAVGRPTCAAFDREGPCSAASDVVWQTEAGAAWACAWHWPSAMAGYPGAEVGAVHAAGAWSTWRDGGSVDLARQGADLFAEAAREHGHVARPLVALDRLDEMLKSLPDDLRGAILLWSIAVTNPDWDVAVVAEHGRATHELVVAQGRAVAFPDEIYFQQEVAHAPISPVAGEADTAAAAGPTGESLFARGTALASSGDLRGAAQAWTEAAESHNHALAMRALGDLSSDRDDLKTAEEWYGRAAMLNDTSSMVRIATLLESRGQQERAAEWLRRAARFGDDEAVRRLAHQGVVGASA